MKKSLVLLSLSSVLAIGGLAQIINENYKTKTFLNDGIVTSGGYSRDQVLALLDKPLLSIDENGKKRQPVSFYLSFKERSVFYNEDYKPFIGCDTYTFESSDGRVGDEVIDILNERLKAGDTLKFESILNYYSIKSQDSAFYSEPITIYIK